MVYPNDQNPLKPCSFLSSTIRPQGSLREKSRASVPGPGAEGIVRVGKLKLTFHCFHLCVWVCVRSISGRVEQYRRLFFMKKCGYPGFFVDAMY